MAIRNRPKVVHYVAWDTVNNQPKTGDVANHSLRIARDLDVIVPSNSPIELDPVHLAGVYAIELTSYENSGESITLGGSSSSSGIVIIAVSYMTETPGSIWSYAHRSLTDEAQFLPPRENRISSIRGDTITFAFDFSDLTGTTSMWFAAKKNLTDFDQDAVALVTLNGLQRLNGHSTQSNLGSLTILDQSAGTVQLVLQAAASEEILAQTLYYDFQVDKSGQRSTPQKGYWTIVPDVTTGKYIGLSRKSAYIKGIAA